jgi:AraC-like DNA-binding protein
MARSIDTTTLQFWHDPRLPFIEARAIQDGRKVCFDRHSHETFSIGAITSGSSTYINGRIRDRVGKGDMVIMNPGDAHACNPINDEPWSYRMFYVDAHWLARLQCEQGLGDGTDFRAFSTMKMHVPELYSGLNGLYAVLADCNADLLEKESAAVQFFSEVQRRLDPAPDCAEDGGRKLQRAAEYIDDNFMYALKLEDICTAAELSPSYLIRAFKQRYGMTPHAYQINRRIQYGRAQLRRGSSIADVAIEAGFADQAHFQRTFKRLVAATPAQYRGRI